MEHLVGQVRNTLVFVNEKVGALLKKYFALMGCTFSSCIYDKIWFDSPDRKYNTIRKKIKKTLRFHCFHMPKSRKRQERAIMVHFYRFLIQMSIYRLFLW